MTLFSTIMYIFSLLIRLTAGDKTLVIVSGSDKSATLELSDFAFVNLNMVEYVLSETKPATATDVFIETVSVNCTLDFDWISIVYHELGWRDESELKDIFPNDTFDNILFLGPLCEYYGMDAAIHEMTDFVTLVQDVYLTRTAKSVTNFFATPSFTVSLLEDDEGIRNVSEQLAQKVNVQPKNETPYFIALSGTVTHFAQIVYKYANFHLSEYTAILSVVNALASHTDVFCRHFTHTLMYESAINNTNFMRHHFVGDQEEDDMLDIWSHVLQRSRYVLFCGDVEPFAQWLEAGRKLWEKHKLSDFGIFYVEYGVDESNEYNFEQLKRSVNGILKRIPEVTHNVKFLSLDPPVPCGFDSGTLALCNKFNNAITTLTDFNFSAANFADRVRYKRKAFFHTLSVFNLFATLFKDPAKFWTSVTMMKNMREELLRLPPVTVSVYDINADAKGATLKKVCNFTNDTALNVECKLDWDGPEPKRKPGRCGYQKCSHIAKPPWKYVLIAVISIIVGGFSIGIFCICGYMKYKRRQQWSVAPLGNVRLKIEDIKQLNSIETAVAKDGTVRRRKVKSTILKATHVVLDPTTMNKVLGTLCNTPILVQPFLANLGNEKAVRDVVVKLREISKENVAKIHGYTIQRSPPVFGLVMETGDRTLNTLLELDEIDLTLKLPLLLDLCRGLAHIHGLPLLNYHGDLNSHCCVIDSHFVLKVQLSDFVELKKLIPQGAKLPQRSDAERVWSAPEILRNEKGANPKLADIYSFGIVVHEIIYQSGPFYVHPRDFSKHLLQTEVYTQGERSKLIVKILKDKNRGAIRPTMIDKTGDESVMVILKEMITNCWKDDPTQRWSLKRIEQSIKKMMADMKIVHVFGTMVERLEFYSKRLQQAIQEKADKVEQERHRVGQVLDKLFPGGIAKKLLNGQRPKPVIYDNVCVHYNDIIGYTNLCASNNTAVVVKFLNQLFTKYDSVIERYNIHPVTRIGDAYMLVSGIPVETDGQVHAAEVAQAALQIVEIVKTSEFGKSIIFNKTDNRLKIRTGIASGSAVAGVVGKEVPSFSIIGETVTVAARMESSSEANRILVAESTYDLLKSEYDFMFAKIIDVNDVGEIRSYWLTGKKGVTKIFTDQRLDGKKLFKDQRKDVAVSSAQH